MGFSTLTFLWPAFVVSHHVGALKGYWLSLRQFFKDPGRIILIALFLILSYLTMGQLGQTGNGILAVFVQFFIFFIQTVFSVLLIVYVLQASPQDPKPDSGESIQ
jgi:bacteriorhodopsin